MLTTPTSTTMTMTTMPSLTQEITKTFESVDKLRLLIGKNVRMEVEECPNQPFRIVTGLLNEIRLEDPYHILNLAPALLDLELLKAITINFEDMRTKELIKTYKHFRNQHKQKLDELLKIPPCAITQS